ncbi:nucleoside diphosphate kinase homolog 5 isoform X2 [Selaginella moellendorffii]|uniref:nucleoside diphosphate kinase homolog 5 isoform X2 n=1 Tax=Selaginella moellendorffii TaxID=88036 RepID=UPI000D1C933B|nr:nucleoside diphosphate kinase homolog 5 isoform X2 [Selaginella moellendorffii]XP_024543453.1 nucleoside diphosphate kinase homolog 5 isoform X2 [Selaginella moellendorffii]|eukprot:XP_024523992.1 nucleoside diphosphate kinase homolog 5 isoform X2 [Selaginella moellendorffii]
MAESPEQARPRELSVNSAAAVDSAISLVVQAVDVERGLTGEETTVVTKAVDSVVSETFSYEQDQLAAAAESTTVVVSEAIKFEKEYYQDHEDAVNESISEMVSESIKTELKFKEQAPTHAKVVYTELTLALIKPDALKAGHDREIRYAMHAHGFVIVHEAYIKFTSVRAGIFYDHHRGKPWFQRLTRFMSSGPVHGFVLGKERAARSWNVVIGPTDPEQARKESPLSLRARFGRDILRNAVHGSFNAARARQEIKFIFPNVVMDPLPDPPKARITFDKTLKRTLIMGLTALCKAKPYSEPLKVLRWFARWLQEHNPNRPYIDGKRYVEVVIPD